MLAAIVIGFISAFFQPTTLALANCPPSSNKLYVYRGMKSGSFYGNSTRNRVGDPNVSHLWVNSIYVDKDSGNLIEVGWAEEPNNVRSAFTVRLYNGVYYESSPFSISVNADHTFKSVSRTVPGGFEWAIQIDGTERWAWSHHYSAGGYVRAVQERDSTCDDSTTHFWSLQYANLDRNFASWYKMDNNADNDSEYTACVIANTEFWVKTAC